MQGKQLSDQQKQKFLAKLRSTAGNVSKAAQSSGFARNAAYDHRKTDADFARAWEDIIEEITDLEEEEAHRRATKGILEPVFYKGEIVGKIRKFSDRLLEFRLKGHRPEIYRERFDVNQQVSGSLDLNIQAAIDHIYSDIDGESNDTESVVFDGGTDQDG